MRRCRTGAAATVSSSDQPPSLSPWQQPLFLRRVSAELHEHCEQLCPGKLTIEKAKEVIGIFQDSVEWVVAEIIFVIFIAIPCCCSRIPYTQHHPDTLLRLQEDLDTRINMPFEFICKVLILSFVLPDLPCFLCVYCMTWPVQFAHSLRVIQQKQKKNRLHLTYRG